MKKFISISNLISRIEYEKITFNNQDKILIII